MAQCIHCFVHGRVQGVWFRAYTQKAAQRLGVAGWVRNAPDGRVETMAQGQAEQLQAFKDWLRQGSPLSRVDRVDCEPAPPLSEATAFSIRR